jgi:hypothetical protein
LVLLVNICYYKVIQQQRQQQHLNKNKKNKKMANSIAYVLSKNTYPDAFQANLVGVNQGTQIVYATTSTLTSANVLFADSRLTQPIYGDGASWYGVQLLTNTAVVYPITISESGVIAIGSGTTTTTAAPTTTTTAAPTTTTTAAP